MFGSSLSTSSSGSLSAHSFNNSYGGQQPTLPMMPPMSLDTMSRLGQPSSLPMMPPMPLDAVSQLLNLISGQPSLGLPMPSSLDMQLLNLIYANQRIALGSGQFGFPAMITGQHTGSHAAAPLVSQTAQTHPSVTLVEKTHKKSTSDRKAKAKGSHKSKPKQIKAKRVLPKTQLSQSQAEIADDHHRRHDFTDPAATRSRLAMLPETKIYIESNESDTQEIKDIINALNEVITCEEDRKIIRKNNRGAPHLIRQLKTLKEQKIPNLLDKLSFAKSIKFSINKSLNRVLQTLYTNCNEKSLTWDSFIQGILNELRKQVVDEIRKASVIPIADHSVSGSDADAPLPVPAPVDDRDSGMGNPAELPFAAPADDRSLRLDTDSRLTPATAFISPGDPDGDSTMRAALPDSVSTMHVPPDEKKDSSTPVSARAPQYTSLWVSVEDAPQRLSQEESILSMALEGQTLFKPKSLEATNDPYKFIRDKKRSQKICQEMDDHLNALRDKKLQNLISMKNGKS